MNANRSSTLSEHAGQGKPAQFRIASARTGAFELIPLPFVDEWLINRQRRIMVKRILDERGIRFDRGVPRMLAGGGRGLFSRIGGAIRGLVFKPLRKIFRSVFFWLTARNAARTALVSYFLARFVHHPGIAPDAGPLTRQRAEELAGVFREVARGLDMKAASDAYRRLLRFFKGNDRIAPDRLSRAIEEEAPGFVAEFDTRIAERLSTLNAPTSAAN